MRSIYLYETPESKEQGLIKIGDAQDVEKRIREQLDTASRISADKLEYTLLSKWEAVRSDGTAFRDHDIHAILTGKGYPKHQIFDESGASKSTEWFKIDPAKVDKLIGDFKSGMRPEEIDIERPWSFGMRPEQQQAVQQTAEYFRDNVKPGRAVEVLWNAKMRFGKTFAAYQLSLALNAGRVLVLTYKPAVEDAWQKDLELHSDFKDFVFLRREALASIEDYVAKGRKVVAFASYQDLLGQKDDDNNIKDKHQQLFNTHWDIVIIDEFHFGAGTKKAKEMLAEQVAVEKKKDLTKADIAELEKEFFAEEDAEPNEELASEAVVAVVEKSITSDLRLYLSGTPFKAMADARFEQDAIFNWTYADEQRAKEQWPLQYPELADENPYQALPQIQLYLYKVSEDLIKAGTKEGRDEFSLNHFFKAKGRRFLNEEAVQKWLNLISGVIRPHIEVDDELSDEVKIQPSQYPFDHEGKLYKELDHTLWYLNRVDSAYALKGALENHAVFKHFHIILAAGKELKSGVDAVQPVLDAIDQHDKTITLSVGKLTTGVSIPKWKGVMFLRDVASPENYFQTAFRAQTPYKNRSTGWSKETCYIFDFSPNRSLRLLTTYSEKLSADSNLTTSEQRIAEFIRYLPVLKVAGNQMVDMDAREVLTFDLSGVDAKGLGSRFGERKNVVVNRDTIEAINANPESQERCQAIFDRIKMFRRFNGATDKDLEQSDASVADLDVNDQKIKELRTKETASPDEEKQRDKAIDKAEKALKSEREKVRDLLRTLLSRIPIFMYLTDATEENMEQVLVDTRQDLFRKATGIDVEDFRYLVELGLLKVDSIDGYILKFINLENQNYQINNDMDS